MNEFNNRIDAQRQILRAVNSVSWPGEPLHGLSTKALERWLSRNGLDADAPLAALLRTAAGQLFFLANRSQEQVTDEYQAHARAIEAIVPQIAVEAGRLAPVHGIRSKLYS